MNQTSTTNAGVTVYTAELAQLRAKTVALQAGQLQLSNQHWNSRLSAEVHLSP